jgi:hypothetical protein
VRFLVSEVPLWRDWYFIAKQPAPAPHLAHPEGCAALRIVLVTVLRVSHSCEHFPDGFDLHLRLCASSRPLPSVARGSCPPTDPRLLRMPYRDTSHIRKRPPPYDPPRTLGIDLLQGPRGGGVLMSEVPLYGRSVLVTGNSRVIAVTLQKCRGTRITGVQGYLAHRKMPPPRALWC